MDPPADVDASSSLCVHGPVDVMATALLRATSVSASIIAKAEDPAKVIVAALLSCSSPSEVLQVVSAANAAGVQDECIAHEIDNYRPEGTPDAKVVHLPCDAFAAIARVLPCAVPNCIKYVGWQLRRLSGVPDILSYHKEITAALHGLISTCDPFVIDDEILQVALDHGVLSVVQHALKRRDGALPWGYEELVCTLCGRTLTARDDNAVPNDGLPGYDRLACTDAVVRRAAVALALGNV
jgi:hypothetical protein